MGNLLYRLMISGDDHLSSKNYGGHRDYAQESLDYFIYLRKLAEQYKATHWIGLGDFSYGRFTTLEYRREVEAELDIQNKLLNGRRYVIKGNHDKASYGMTEYEYYLSRGRFKGSERLELGNLVIDMRDYGDLSGVDVSDGKKHILLTHGFFTFDNTSLPDYGVSTKLDNKHDWYGLDWILCGHIHEEHVLEGFISNGNGRTAQSRVHYLPCLSRPSYHREQTPVKGAVDFIDVYDDGNYYINRLEIDLLPLEKSFDIEAINKEAEHKEAIRIDLSDVVKSLNNHEIAVGNPEDIIMSREDIPLKYRQKAVELLKTGVDK